MRVKTGVVRRRRHKKVLKLARGFIVAEESILERLKNSLKGACITPLGIANKRKESSGVCGW